MRKRQKLNTVKNMTNRYKNLTVNCLRLFLSIKVGYTPYLQTGNSIILAGCCPPHITYINLLKKTNNNFQQPA